MKLEEAAKSKRAIKRKGDCYWIQFIETSQAYENKYIYVNEALADDWEVEEEKVEITRDQLAKAWDNCIGVYAGRSFDSVLFEYFRKELGFK